MHDFIIEVLQSDTENKIIIQGDTTSDDVKRLEKNIAFLLKGTQDNKQLIGRHNDQIYLLKKQDIIYFESTNDTVYAMTKTGKYSVRYKLYELEKLLDEDVFIRISKWCIVNIDTIEKIEADFNSTMIISFQEVQTKQRITRSYLKFFQEKVLGER